MGGRLELPLVCGPRSATLYLTAAQDHGWYVCAKADGVVIAQAHCRDWHRVERFRERVRQMLRPADAVITDDGARRAAA